MPTFGSTVKGEYEEQCVAYIVTINLPHFCLIINDNKIFDPTDLLPNLYETFHQIIAMREDLHPKRIVKDAIEKGWCVEIPIPKHIYIEDYRG